MKSLRIAPLRFAAISAAALSLFGMQATTLAEQRPITPGQRQVAQAVSEKGVPLTELAPDAPDQYTVKRGDTLWDISKVFLRSPWHWPELWGMNFDEIRNPHRIYPGQTLVLVKGDGKASLRLAGNESTSVTMPDGVVKLSPRTRAEDLADQAIPAINPAVIEAFLAEPLIVNANELQNAARIVSPREDRVLISRGDRVYARGPVEKPLLDNTGKEQLFRVFHKAIPLKDPATGEILAYEAQFAGKAMLVRGEMSGETVDDKGKVAATVTPATIDIVLSKDEILVGDRLLPEPDRDFPSYTPHLPINPVIGRVVSVYGSSVVNAGQNQVVAINLGSADGIDPGTVFAIVRDGKMKMDPEDPKRTMLKLPDERNGLMMVFRTFERVSYALILEISDPVRVGNRLISPN